MTSEAVDKHYAAHRQQTSRNVCDGEPTSGRAARRSARWQSAWSSCVGARSPCLLLVRKRVTLMRAMRSC